MYANRQGALQPRRPNKLYQTGQQPAPTPAPAPTPGAVPPPQQPAAGGAGQAPRPPNATQGHHGPRTLAGASGYKSVPRSEQYTDAQPQPHQQDFQPAQQPQLTPPPPRKPLSFNDLRPSQPIQNAGAPPPQMGGFDGEEFGNLNLSEDATGDSGNDFMSNFQSMMGKGGGGQAVAPRPNRPMRPNRPIRPQPAQPPAPPPPAPGMMYGGAAAPDVRDRILGLPPGTTAKEQQPGYQQPGQPGYKVMTPEEEQRAREEFAAARERGDVTDIPAPAPRRDRDYKAEPFTKQEWDAYIAEERDKKANPEKYRSNYATTMEVKPWEQARWDYMAQNPEAKAEFEALRRPKPPPQMPGNVTTWSPEAEAQHPGMKFSTHDGINGVWIPENEKTAWELQEEEYKKTHPTQSKGTMKGKQGADTYPLEQQAL